MGTAADLFVQCLKAGGIDTVYALPGEETNALMDALATAGMDVVLCRHEQAAAFMAAVHGRLTGHPAACLATLGPGATNLVTGVADAMLDRVPLVAISGQAARSRLHRDSDSHQVIDLARLFDPITKLSKTLASGAQIPETVAEAIRLARAPRPGAVHLSLPEDLAAEVLDGTPLPVPDPILPHFNPTALSAALMHLTNAERPIVLAGAGVLRHGATDALADVLAETGLPLATSFAAKGLLDANHPQHLGAFGLPTEDHVDRAIASADLILAVGYDPVEYPVSALTDGTTPVVALSEASLPLDVGWPLAASVEGDLVASLSTMVRGLEARRWTIWDTAKDARRSLHADLAQARAAADQTPPTAQSLATAVSDGILPDDTTICGVGTHKLAMARNFMPKRPGQIVIANGLAGMGLAVPGAIAAARLQPAGRSIAICGDGEVMMNVQEFETATRLNLALMVVVWIDGAFGLIEDKQEAETGTRPDLSFATMDWAALARAFGWIHRPCDTAADLRDALHAFDGGRHLVTVPVSYAGDLA